MEFTDLEVSLIQLSWITNRLNAIPKKFLEIQGNDKTTLKFKAIIREYIIIQLHNFIKIRHKLIQNPKVKKIDDCLKPLWNPILEVKIPIKKLRNKYIAHIQENEKKPFEISITEIIDQYQLPTTFGFWLYLVYCEVCYELFLAINLTDEYDKSQKKYQSILPAQLLHGTINVKNFRPKVVENVKSANKNLKSKNFKIFEKIPLI